MTAAVAGRDSGAHRAAVLENMFGNGAALQHAERELKKILEARGVLFGDRLLPTYAYAFVTSRARVERWGRQAELLINAADHVAREAAMESVTCDTQLMNNEVSELIFTYPGYERICVICRPDGIPQGDDVRFVELNCDSPAMMMFLDIVSQALLQLEVFAPYRDQLSPETAADKLLETLLACYKEYGGTETPTIAISDWEGQKTRFEHQRLADHFRERGYPTIVCDPRSFKNVGGHLQAADGRRVHLVYRRALITEIIERRHEVEPLLQAYRDHTVCLVNPLRSYIASAKSIMSRLVDTRDLPDELKPAAKLLPRTVLLDDPVGRKEVVGALDRWVLKKSEGHGGKNVLLPGVALKSAFIEAMELSKREVWIAQEYLNVPKISLPYSAEGSNDLVWQDKFYNWNPFVFGGRYAGGLVRTSNTPLINITQGGGLLPTFGA